MGWGKVLGAAKKKEELEERVARSSAAPESQRGNFHYGFRAHLTFGGSSTKMRVREKAARGEETHEKK